MSEKAPQKNSNLVAGQFSEIDQKIYSNDVKHVYGVDPKTGKKRHISHEEILNAYGHTSKEVEQNTADFVMNPQESVADSFDVTEDDIEDQENIDSDWQDLKVSFAEAKKSRNFDDMVVAMDEFKMFVAQFEEMSEEEKNAMYNELLDSTEEVKATDSSEQASKSTTDTVESDEANAANAEDQAFNEGIEALRNKYANKDLSDEAVRQQCLDDINALQKDTKQHYDNEVILGVISATQIEGEHVTSSETMAEEENKAEESEVSEETTDEPVGVYNKLRNWWKNKTAKANAAVTVAALNGAERAKSSEKKKKIAAVAVGIGILAVGIAAWKYGTAETAAAVGTAAEKAGKHGDKLSHAQEALLDASGATPWDRYADVYGPDKAATKLLRAVERLKESGVKVIEHGSGADYWIEVPKANGNGMTSNVSRVTKVLATGTV